MTNQAPALAQPDRQGLSYATVSMESVGAGGALAPKTLGDVVAFAKVMSRAAIALPKHLRDNDGACMAVAMQAMRWEMDPFAVANKSYSVNDRLAYEAQLIAAVVHTRAPIRGRPNYIFTGQGVTRRCQVVCVMADGEEREYTSPEFGQITTKNSPLWKSDPDQQLGYFAIRSWARRHTPEVILGVYTPEETATFNEVRDVTPRPSGLRERLETRREAALEGFTSAQAEEQSKALDDALDGDQIPAHDAETGEVIDAEVEEKPREEPKPEPTGAPSLADRAAAYEARMKAAPTTIKLTAIRNAGEKLRTDLDKSDPERLVELEEVFNATFAALQDAERAEAGQ
jgi:hypothetical protein